jgi:hypothetical protein
MKTKSQIARLVLITALALSTWPPIARVQAAVSAAEPDRTVTLL